MTENYEIKASDEPNSDKRTGRKYPIWKMLGGGVLLGALLVGLIILGLILKEYWRTLPLPKMPAYALKQRVRNGSDARGETRSTPIQSPSGQIKPASSQMQMSDTTATLQFEPFIPDMPEIPPGLKARAAEINLLFDRIYRRIAEYERAKEPLKPEDTIKTVNQIASDYNAATQKIWEALGNRMDFKTFLLLQERDLDFGLWYDAAGLEAYARNKKWAMAGHYAKNYWYAHEQQWLEQQENRTVFKSDYNRETGLPDYQRALYYYQREGGVNGFADTVQLYYERKRDEFSDWLRGGRKIHKPGMAQRVIMVKKR